MRKTLLFVCALVVGACGPKRAGDDDEGGGDGGGGKCGAGCQAPLVCAPELGCVECLPNTRFCAAPDRPMSCDVQGRPSTLAQCDGSMALTCEAGDCIPACTSAARRRSNIGCEYWPVDLPQFCDATQLLATCTRDDPYAVLVANLNAFPVRLVVEKNDAAPGQPAQLVVVDQRDVPARATALFELPQREVDNSNNTDPESLSALTSRAYRLTSSGPVVAYQLNTLRETDSIDASLLIPTSGLDKRYRTISWPSAVLDVLGTRARNRGFVTIVGTAANTNVTVTSGGHIVGGSGVNQTMKDGVLTAVLGPFDVLHLAGTQTGGLSSTREEGDLSNTIVQADQPVAVYAGASCANVTGPMGSPPPPMMASCCCDHLEEQVPPASALGTKFAVTRSAQRSTDSYIEPDVWRIIADQGPTTVRTSLPAPWDQFTLEQNKTVEFWSQTNFTLEASKPVLLAQFLVSTDWGADTGDPALTYMPPIDQARGDYVFLVPQTYTQNWAVIGRPVGSTLKVDGREVPGEFGTCVLQPIGSIDGKAYESVKCPMTAGQHTLEASLPVTLIVYGYGGTGSIAYLGGADVKRINPID